MMVIATSLDGRVVYAPLNAFTELDPCRPTGSWAVAPRSQVSPAFRSQGVDLLS
jgi:hypothetical protein